MDTASENCSVKVAVHVRPLIGDERAQGCKECVAVTHGNPQVTKRTFGLQLIKRIHFVNFRLRSLLSCCECLL